MMRFVLSSSTLNKLELSSIHYPVRLATKKASRKLAKKSANIVRKTVNSEFKKAWNAENKYLFGAILKKTNENLESGNPKHLDNSTEFKCDLHQLNDRVDSPVNKLHILKTVSTHIEQCK